jgi:squalene synthase HpnC
MASVILEQLDTFGPANCRRLSYADAAAYTRNLATTHYENFSVVNWLLPKRLHEDFANVYAFCRWADDLGDETGDPRRSLELLAWWKCELAACYAGSPRHPVFVALQKTIANHAIPADPFEKLIDAFEQDQRVDRYENWPQVLDYCTRSADPVGRLVLYLCDLRDEPRQRLSDATCTALQLINFWQDVRRDIVERNRIYLPADALAAAGLSHQMLVDHVNGKRSLTAEQMASYHGVIRELVDRTTPLFQEGRRLWPLLPRDMRVPIQLFTLGGEAIVKRVHADGYDTLEKRPSLSKAAKAGLMMRALAGRYLGVGVTA